MTAYELREIKGVRAVNLSSYHRALHELRSSATTYQTAWCLGWIASFKLTCRLLRRLHRWAAERYAEEHTSVLGRSMPYVSLKEWKRRMANGS